MHIKLYTNYHIECIQLLFTFILICFLKFIHLDTCTYDLLILTTTWKSIVWIITLFINFPEELDFLFYFYLLLPQRWYNKYLLHSSLCMYIWTNLSHGVTTSLVLIGVAKLLSKWLYQFMLLSATRILSYAWCHQTFYLSPIGSLWTIISLLLKFAFLN